MQMIEHWRDGCGQGQRVRILELESVDVTIDGPAPRNSRHRCSSCGRTVCPVARKSLRCTPS